MVTEMLDWVVSKIAMSVAAVILIVIGAGYIESQRDGFEEMALRNTALDIAECVDETASVNVNTTLRLGPRTATDLNGYLPSQIDGRSYTIRVTAGGVLLDRGSDRASAQFHTTVHPWRPQRTTWTATDLEQADADTTTYTAEAGATLVLTRQLLTVDGEHQWHTFLYRE